MGAPELCLAVGIFTGLPRPSAGASFAVLSVRGAA
jgi:hypothetical protein